MKKPQKRGWNENEKKQGRKTKAELVPHTMKNDPWSDHPETQFGPTYPFFRNPEPRPTLRAEKVHFDWIWILRLKKFFLRKFSSKNHLDKSPTYLGWILNFQVHDRTIKEKGKKENDWKKRRNMTLGWKPEKGQSRAKMRKFSKTYGQSG